MQQQAAAVMEGLLHTQHNNSIVIWDLPNTFYLPPNPSLTLFMYLQYLYRETPTESCILLQHRGFFFYCLTKPVVPDGTEEQELDCSYASHFTYTSRSPAQRWKNHTPPYRFFDVFTASHQQITQKRCCTLVPKWKTDYVVKQTPCCSGYKVDQ